MTASVVLTCREAGNVRLNTLPKSPILTHMLEYAVRLLTLRRDWEVCYRTRYISRIPNAIEQS